MRLKAYLEDRLADERVRNDKSLSEMETATLRGRIDTLKKMIALGNDRPMTGDGEQPP